MAFGGISGFMHLWWTLHWSFFNTFYDILKTSTSLRVLSILAYKPYQNFQTNSIFVKLHCRDFFHQITIIHIQIPPNTTLGTMRVLWGYCDRSSFCASSSCTAPSMVLLTWQLQWPQRYRVTWDTHSRYEESCCVDL